MALLTLLLNACAPTAFAPGPDVHAPRLTQTAAILADGAELPLRSWAPAGEPEAVLIALHGFNDYGDFFKTPGAWLAENANLQVYAFDQRGFGENETPGLWAGWQAMTRDLGVIADLLKARHPSIPLYILGASMGGAVVLASERQDLLASADGLILTAPAVWGRDTWPFYQRWALGLSSRLLPAMKLSGRGLNIKPSDNWDMLVALGQDPLVIKETRVDAIYGLADLMDLALLSGPDIKRPTLLIYGLLDEIIPKPATRRFLTSLPEEAPVDIRLFEDGWHMLLRDLQGERVWQTIAEWISGDKKPSSPDDRSAAIERLSSVRPAGG